MSSSSSTNAARQPKTIAIVGAGGRGQCFASLIKQMSHLGKVVAVAEPRDDCRSLIARENQVPEANVFRSWAEFCARPKMADAAVISTMDRDHVGPAVQCLDKGYDLLVEKPMGVSVEEYRAIEAAQRRNNRIVGVCHSMRYQKGYAKLKELVASGIIGRVVTLDQIEQVAFWHQAHSFVRGNWGNESRSTFMLLAKSCHDMDYIAYLIGKPCISVTSFGGLTYFRKENAPAGSSDRCVDCDIEPTCAYSAVKQYLDGNREHWPAATCSLDHSYEAHREAIRTGPYGRCVWKCDNDAVDHQVVAMQFAEGITATFTMTAFTLGGGRKVRVHGTEGEILFDEGAIAVHTFADRNVTRIELGHEPGGHGGGDYRMAREWLWALHTRDDSKLVANAQESLRTHTITFAAERSRREGRLVRIEEM